MLIGFVAVPLLVVLLGVGLLYAYRAQSPATKVITLSDALARVDQGQVKTVTLNNNTRATIQANDGTLYQVTLTGDDTFTKAVNDYNASHPGHQVTVTAEPQSPTLGLIGSVILSLLPLALLIGLVLLAAAAIGRARSGDRYEALLHAADLRDRGVLSQDEFEREKRRILK